MWVYFDVRDNREWTFYLDEALLMDSYFMQKQQLEVKNMLKVDLFLTNMQLFKFYKTLIDEQCCGWLVDYCEVFISSFWRHPFTAEDPLLSK